MEVPGQSRAQGCKWDYKTSWNGQILSSLENVQREEWKWVEAGIVGEAFGLWSVERGRVNSLRLDKRMKE